MSIRYWWPHSLSTGAPKYLPFFTKRLAERNARRMSKAIADGFLEGFRQAEEEKKRMEVDGK